MKVLDDQYANLHGHTTLSPGDGYMNPADHAEEAANLGQPAIAVTEHGNVSSHVKMEQAADKFGIQAILGSELYCDTGQEGRGQLKHHLTVLASNQIGLRNLYRTVSKSWENFHFKPTTTGEMLATHHKGLIVLSGCLGGRLATAMLGGKGTEEHTADLRAAGRVAAKFREIFGDRYYLECQPHPILERQKAYNQGLARLSKKMRIPLVATGDVHYPRAEHQPVYPLLHAIDRGGGKNTLEAQSQSWEYGILLAHQRARDIYRGLRETGLSKVDAAGAMASTLEIVGRCNVRIPKLKDLVFPGDEPAPALFRRLIEEGWRYRGFDRLNRADRREYMRRVKLELDLMERKGFLDYFLVIGDMVRWAKDNGIPVGPARGSAAASLVCYLLRITEVNPMHYPNLIFARFIDENRHDLPDVDLDFDDEQRWRVRAYLVEKYGADRVGNIGNFVRYKGKNSLEDVAKVHRIPTWVVNEVKESLIERSSGDLRASATIEDSIEMFPKLKKLFDAWPGLYDARLLEGNLKGFSVHAAGLVVANEPLTNSLAVYTREDSKTKKRAWVLSIDKYDAEYVGALKIDALGLTTMGLISRALKMIGMTLEELYAVPLDDEKVYESFRRNEVVGVFQFDGRAMRSVNREVKPDTFAEICDINALARPGPLHSGAAAEYIMAKHKKKKVERLHPVVSEITAHTQGQIVYQEQILRVVRELGGFSWEEAANVRKLISKKQGEQAFNRLQGKFLEGSANLGLPNAIALKIWKQLVTAGAYAFNAAHCVSYGLLAYWTMWLKVNHPLEFYCAALQKFSTPNHKEKSLDVLKEASAKGIKILPPSARYSGLTWKPQKNARVAKGRRGPALRAGLTQVRGIGDKLATQMIEYRNEWSQDAAVDGNPERFTWDHWMAMKGFGPGKLKMITEFCAQEDPFGIDTMRKTLAKVRRWLFNNGDAYQLPFPSSRSDDIPYEAIKGEHTWVGYVRNRNLKDIYELHRSRTGEELDPEKVREPEYVNYVVITGEDETGPMVVTVHRWRGFYERYKEVIWDMNPATDLLLVRGYKRAEYRRAIYATELHVLRMEGLV